MQLCTGGQITASAFFEDIDGTIPVQAPNKEKQDSFVVDVRSALNLDSYFLADERRLDSDIFTDNDDDERLRLPDITQIERYYRTSLSGRRLSAHIDVRNGQLQLALDRALQWVRPQVLAGADVGTVNTNTIYADLVKRLSIESDLTLASEQQSVAPDIAPLMENIAIRAANQAEFGLTSRIDTQEMITALGGRHPIGGRRLIVELLQPYLDGIKARLDAMEDLYTILKAFTESLNSFFLDKHATFDVRRGLLVRTEDGVPLAPEQLSSREK